jgi:ribosomal-protein-alanine N-acetyltransferase
MLEVRADNGPARALYERAGYQVLSTRRRYYQPGDVDAIVMRKLLHERGPDVGQA